VLSFAAIALAAASAATTPSLMSNSPWWEKITYIYDDNGSHRSCAYETNLAIDPTEACDVANAPAKETGGSGVMTKITFERRFTPGAPPEIEKLQPGDKLLGGLMMMVAFDKNGAVRGCSVVAETGDAKPEYGCEQVREEKFQASATVGAQSSSHGFLTVIVYGHEEELV
jgi:hypothetical protein